MTSIYEYDPAAFEAVFKDASTAEYLKAWNILHTAQYKAARKYYTDIRIAQHAASSEAIRQILS